MMNARTPRVESSAAPSHGANSPGGAGHNYRNQLGRYDWDWTPFNECFAPSRIRISDIDGVVERNGHFLFLEGKTDGAVLPRGQAILLGRLGLLPGATVCLFYGHPPTGVTRAAWWGTDGLRRAEAPISEAGLRAFVSGWFQMANKG